MPNHKKINRNPCQIINKQTKSKPNHKARSGARPAPIKSTQNQQKSIKITLIDFKKITHETDRKQSIIDFLHLSNDS